MHIVFYGHARNLFRRLKKRTKVYVKSQVGKCSGNHFCAAGRVHLDPFSQQESVDGALPLVQTFSVSARAFSNSGSCRLSEE